MTASTFNPDISGYLRADGSKGIRNCLLVVYTVECARHVADQIVRHFPGQPVHLIGFSGCFPNEYAFRILTRLCTHTNAGAALLVSLGCEGLDRGLLARSIRNSGRPVEKLVIQESGGTRKTLETGIEWVKQTLVVLEKTPKVPVAYKDLVVGTICGGSDATSGITSNPVIGRCFDMLVEKGATVIFEETGELIGCEQIMAERAETPELAEALIDSVRKADQYYSVLGHGSFAPGNADGGLTTIEEKSMGAYAKSGQSIIRGIIKPGDPPSRNGLYLLDVVPDGEVRFGFPNICDNAEIAELIACGAHLVLFSTGRGSVVGSAISPVIKICGNPETCSRMPDDIDVDASLILDGTENLESVARTLLEEVNVVAAGQETASEALGHQEFILTYKQFDKGQPGCFPN